MNKLLLILLLTFPFILLGQNKDKAGIELIRSEKGLHFLNNQPNCNYIIEFQGDSIRHIPDSKFIEIDKKIVSITDYPFSQKELSNKDESSKTLILLEDKMKSEQEYLEKEIFKSEIKINRETFLNKENKQFLIWTFQVPKKFRKKLMKEKNLVESPIANSLLFCVSNGVIIGISLSTMEKENLASDLAYLKSTAERIDIFGGPMDKRAWYYKVQSMENDEPFTYRDTVNNFKISIPYWLNIIDANKKGVFVGTLPDINNIKNAILVNSHDKSEFESFDAFNEHYITGNRVGESTNFNENIIWMGQKEVATPKESNGISYKVYYQFGSSIYHCLCVTYESESSYILINFTATEKTYKTNKDKIEEFLNNFELIKK